ncbi:MULTISPECIES: hypothetical protein [Haloferax]|uniref:DUF7527 domain-containing protein n=1 Tax=Haloferax marinum TaxID=2666143 RepID=A0A6A8G699_9EURY|nr:MULTISPECIES: hypothetical protein [Haloferax]KAB1196641.1 hypothetical protein Hfx1150_03555 [Haloferax sp. CBA1150]MRW95646.1 hypothetical protein [Haloferax marinum]
MDSEIIDAVTGWDSAPAERGYGGLRSLADDGFSGAVVAGMTWGFMLNGRLLGVFDGTIADFDDESFEAYRAPDPSLPLLYAMQETGGDVRAQYYSEDTPLNDANSTLSAGGFTGYVELSENVLSGDYYTVYHGGKSMSVAFVGNSSRLVTGDEAFELADDEIGIYKVYDVDIDLVEIPGDDGDDASAEDDTTDAAVGGAAGGADAESDEQDEPVSDTESPTIERAEANGGAESASSTPSADTSNADATGASATEQTASSTTDTATQVPQAESSTDDTPASTTSASATTADSGSKNGSSSDADDDDDGDDVFSAEAEWRNARSIPSLDPRDSEGESVKDRPGKGRRGKQGPKRAKRSRSSSTQNPSKSSTSNGSSSSPSTSSKPTKPTSAVSAGKVQSLREELASVKSERDSLVSERDTLQRERDEYRQRADELESRVEELESELEDIRAELDENGVTLTDRSMPADEALRGTNLFVRYAKKSGATLEKAHAGQAKQDDVVENLRLEHHTTFDVEGLGVDGKPYEEFLHDSAEFGFAKWAVTDLLYEIGQTGNRSSLAGVFDSIPEVDRIELYGTVSIPIDEGESESRRFDIIFRDQMGNPLFVANMNDSRDPATYSMVQQLINDSKNVADGNETLGSAFVVTKSFFEPEALEAATEETGGGLLSRSKRKSFVKLSRKQGYHLCLVEARSGEFHLNVPDL